MVTGSSSEPKEDYPSFFKVVRYPSATHLSLPNSFVRKYLEKIPKNPILKTETAEHSWRLKIIKIDENYCFAHGWEKLAKDVQLGIRDIVVFWLVDPFTFQVTFLDANGCDKILPLNKIHDGEAVPHEDLCFQKVISEKTHKYYMWLPSKFVRAAGLEKKTSVMMKDHEGKEWIMGIVVERHERPKHRLSGGWTFFREYHKLSDGDICLFKFNKKEGVLNLAQVLKSRTPSHGGADVKIEDEWSPIERPCDGVKVKIEDESPLQIEMVKRKKRGKPSLEKHSGGCVKVKIEDESGPEVDVLKTKRGRLHVENLSGVSGVQVRTEPEMDRVVIIKRVVYF